MRMAYGNWAWETGEGRGEEKRLFHRVSRSVGRGRPDAHFSGSINETI